MRKFAGEKKFAMIDTEEGREGNSMRISGGDCNALAEHDELNRQIQFSA